MEPARQTNALDRHPTGMSGQTTGMSQAVECGGEVGAKGSKERSQVGHWNIGAPAYRSSTSNGQGAQKGPPPLAGVAGLRIPRARL